MRKFWVAIAAAAVVLSFRTAAYAEGNPLLSQPSTDEVIVYGSIQPSKKVVISARAAGTIEFLPPIEGAEVKSGEVVLLINKEDYELKADVLKSQMKLAEISKEQANREFKRLDSLYESKAISQQAKDSAYFGKESADANLGLVKSNLNVIEKALRDTVSTTPISGSVSTRLHETGDFIAPGLPVLEIVNIDSVKAVFKVPENFITKVKPGSRIEIYCENDSNIATSANVTSINPIGDAGNHVFEIIIIVDNTARAFKSGMFVKGVLKLEKNSEKTPPGGK